MWVGAALSGGHSKHMAVPIPAPQGAGTAAKCETLDVTFPAAGLMGRTQTLPVGVKSSTKAWRKISLLSFPCMPLPSHPSDPDAPFHAAARG